MYSHSDQAAELLATAADLSDDERLHLLSNERRRVVLAVLADSELPLTVDEIAPAVERRVSGNPHRRTVRVSLHHVHLPMLADRGVLEYDPDGHRVEALTTGDDPVPG